MVQLYIAYAFRGGGGLAGFLLLKLGFLWEIYSKIIL